MQIPTNDSVMNWEKAPLCALFCQCNNAGLLICPFSPEQKSIFFYFNKRQHNKQLQRCAAFNHYSASFNNSLRNIVHKIVVSYPHEASYSSLDHLHYRGRHLVQVGFLSPQGRRDDAKTHPVRSKQPLLHL